MCQTQNSDDACASDVSSTIADGRRFWNILRPIRENLLRQEDQPLLHDRPALGSMVLGMDAPGHYKLIQKLSSVEEWLRRSGCTTTLLL